MADIINRDPIEMAQTKSIFGNFNLTMEVANTRPGELITAPIESFERHETFFDWEWFNAFNTDFFEPSDNLLWIGSCIAEDFGNIFDQYTNSNKVIRLGQGVNCFRSQEVFLRWLFDDEPFDLVNNPPWEGFKEKEYYISKRDREMMRLQIANCNKVVLFTGTTELLYDSHTGLDLHRMPPTKYLDWNRHKIRRCTYEENVTALRNVIALLEKHLAKDILFITTPFGAPSQSWEGDQPPLPLTAIGKATIRSAINEVRPLDYFPMYEMIYEYIPMFRDKGQHIHYDVTKTFVEMLAIWYGNFPNTQTKKEFMQEFGRLRKSFVLRQLESRAMPKEDVAPAQSSPYTKHNEFLDEI